MRTPSSRVIILASPCGEQAVASSARHLATWIVALSFGLLLGLGHAPFLMGPICIVGFVALLCVIEFAETNHQLVRYILAGALIYFGMLNAWFVTLTDELSYFALLLGCLSTFALASSLVPCCLAARCLLRKGLPLWLTLPFLWTAHEAMQSLDLSEAAERGNAGDPQDLADERRLELPAPARGHVEQRALFLG